MYVLKLFSITPSIVMWQDNGKTYIKTFYIGIWQDDTTGLMAFGHCLRQSPFADMINIDEKHTRKTYVEAFR